MLANQGRCELERANTFNNGCRAIHNRDGRTTGPCDLTSFYSSSVSTPRAL